MRAPVSATRRFEPRARLRAARPPRRADGPDLVLGRRSARWRIERGRAPARSTGRRSRTMAVGSVDWLVGEIFSFRGEAVVLEPGTSCAPRRRARRASWLRAPRAHAATSRLSVASRRSSAQRACSRRAGRRLVEVRLRARRDAPARPSCRARRARSGAGSAGRCAARRGGRSAAAARRRPPRASRRATTCGSAPAGSARAGAALLDAAVPRAHVLADVAAVDLLAELRAVRLRDRRGRLRPVREAASSRRACPARRARRSGTRRCRAGRAAVERRAAASARARRR